MLSPSTTGRQRTANWSGRPVSGGSGSSDFSSADLDRRRVSFSFGAASLPFPNPSTPLHSTALVAQRVGGSVVLAFLTPQRKGQSLAAGFILLRARYVVTDGVCWHSVRRTTSRCGRQCVCLVGSWCDRRVLTQNNAALQSLGRSVLRCADGPDYLFIIQPKASG